MLEIRGLSAAIEDKPILQGIDLTVPQGEVHAIMGPNGSGKSTLSHVIAGKPGYEVTAGEVLFNGEDLLAMSPDERSAKGVFLAFQYPVEIPGVATMTFLRTALNSQRKTRGEPELSTPEFIKRVRDLAGKLGIEQEMLRRGLNVGFSGGEKKRNEILQMALLEPKLGVLDETDSGLDIDALKVVADGVNRLRSPEYLQLVRDAGFELVVEKPSGPSEAGLKELESLTLAPRFRRFPPEELGVTVLSFVAVRPA